MSEQNREKEERLFRALSGVEEELLHRSEQNEGVESKWENTQISSILCVPHCGSLSLLRGHGGCVCDSTQQLQNGRQYKQ